MNRPGGVTFSAVFLIIGSVLAVFTGLFMLFADSLVPLETPQPPFARTMAMLAAVMLFAGAIWGLATAIGLLRMRRWARICILVIGVLLLFFFGLSLVMMIFLMPSLMPSEESAVGINMVMGIVTVVYIVPIAMGTWWLIYFTRGAVKTTFLQGSAPDAGPHRPLSITIIAWHAIVFGLVTIAYLVMRWPPYVFGIVLTGWAGTLTNLIFIATELASGVGLLKLKPWAHTTAVWFCIFVMVQVLVGAFLPDQDARVAALMHQLASDLRVDSTSPPQWSLWIGPVVVWSSFGVALWYLFTRKKAFLEAGKAAQAPA